jgi:hypothetical protein
MYNPLLTKNAKNRFSYPDADYWEAKVGPKSMSKVYLDKYRGGLFDGGKDFPQAMRDYVKNTVFASVTASSTMNSDADKFLYGIAKAIGGRLISSTTIPSYIETPNGMLIHLNVEEGGLATFWNEQTTNESNAFPMDDLDAAIEAARSILPIPKLPSRKRNLMDDLFNPKKPRKAPLFTKEDKTFLHSVGIKASLKPVWDRAINAGMLQFASNRYTFTKDASVAIRSGLKDSVVRVNCALNRLHIPKRASAHEAAVKEMAWTVVTSNRKLDKMGRLAKKAANATHILYDAGPTSYTVRVMRGNSTIDEYNGGNSPFDSTSQFNRTNDDAIEYRRLLELAEQTAKEYAVEYGVPENMIDHDEDLMAEEREEAGMDFTTEDKDELRSMGIKGSKDRQASAKPKCPHCGASKYVLMPTDFETAKCSECGKNWDHGIVPGINDPSDKTASSSKKTLKLTSKFLQPKKGEFTPEEAKEFQEQNQGSKIELNKGASWEDGLSNEDCPLPDRDRCNTTDADTCCGGGFAYDDKRNWVGVPCPCKDCHPPLMGTDHPHAEFIKKKFEQVSSQKTANVYRVEKGGDGEWYIRGLKEGDSPDTFIMPGMNHSIRNPKGLTQGVYEEIYAELQTNDNLKEGDIFETPVGQFICQGFHVLPLDDTAKAALKEVDEQYQCVTCGCDQGDHRVTHDGEFTDYMECKNHPNECREFKKQVG